MTVKVGEMTLYGVMPEGTNPLPRFRRQMGFGTFVPVGEFPPEMAENLGSATLTLPYKMQDRYTRKRQKLTLKTAVLENKYLKATFTLQIGGKLWSLYDKVNGREVLMANPVLQPCNLAIRNAWTSGGIEWNFGSAGHTYFTCDDVWAAVLKDADGEEFLRIYEFERAKECTFQLDFHLPENSAQLYCHVRVTNPNKEDRTTYWWTNIAVPEDNRTRVLSSSEHVIVACGGNKVSYEKLPYLSVMDGDLSYSINSDRSFDYFFQPDGDVLTSWEAGVNGKGFAFYDRSTAPLIYHKMFCWGNHRGGERWQRYLSDGEKGRYIELQAGFARSQFHDKPFPAGASFEWTQCFGGTFIEPEKIHGVTLHEADGAMEKLLDTLVSEETLLKKHKKYTKSAQISALPEQIIHSASGFGALENLRREARGEEKLPPSLCFPQSSIGEEQKEWAELLCGGILKEADPDEIPPSYMVSPSWMKILEESFERPGGRNWYSLLHYGNMLYEFWDNTVTADKAKYFADKDKYELLAEQAWKQSDEMKPNAWAKRNLAVLYRSKGDGEAAERLYDEIIKMPVYKKDFAFASEYMGWLNSDGKYEKAWEIYEGCPEEYRQVDRMILHAMLCAMRLGKLGFLKPLFAREYAVIREGENSLTDIWFEYNARLKAENYDKLSEDEKTRLLSEAEENCPPPDETDFRMSYNKKFKYRKTE